MPDYGDRTQTLTTKAIRIKAGGSRAIDDKVQFTIDAPHAHVSLTEAPRAGWPCKGA